MLLALVLAVAVVGFFLIETVGGQLTSGNLTAQQIAQYASNAGFSGDDLITAIAIALAESSGDPNAKGDNGTSYGLWQIHWTVHPEFAKDQLFDPQYNANAAYQLYSRRGGFADWSTYTVADGNGNYAFERYLGQASNAVGAA